MFGIKHQNVARVALTVSGDHINSREKPSKNGGMMTDDKQGYPCKILAKDEFCMRHDVIPDVRSTRKGVML
jgi:hypothetical protein